MSTSPLVKALEKIDSWIKNSNSQHAERIRGEYDYRLTRTSIELNEYTPQPGIEREMLELYAEEIDFKLSEEIYELYEWHNGNFMIGDVSNPVYFVSFEDTFLRYAEKARAFPLFIDDDLYYFAKEATEERYTSPIYALNQSDFLSCKTSFIDNYAPSITSYMQAMAECIETYNEISIVCSDYYSQWLKYRPLFARIYEKYGVNTEGNVIWS
jgi:hypothetical protein